MAAVAGAYAGTIAWRSREHWLTVVVPTAIALGRETMRGRVSERMLRRYLHIASLYAVDQRTGRCCIVRPDTIASVLDVDVRTVKRCRAVARDLGLEHVAMHGRMLNLAERQQAQDSGSRQRGLSTEVGFCVPRMIPRHLWTATPSRGGRGEITSHLSTTSPRAARGEKNDAASPRPQPRERRDRPARRLAAQLAHIVPWLATEQPGRCAPSLARFARCEPAWRPQELSQALATVLRRRGHDPSQLTADRIRTRPAVVLAALLTDVHEVADHPRRPDMTDPSQPWVPADAVRPCGRNDCQDGWLGWTYSDEHGDTVVVHPADTAQRPCPDCDPRVRRGLTVMETVARADLYGDW